MTRPIPALTALTAATSLLVSACSTPSDMLVLDPRDIHSLVVDKDAVATLTMKETESGDTVYFGDELNNCEIGPYEREQLNVSLATVYEPGGASPYLVVDIRVEDGVSLNLAGSNGPSGGIWAVLDDWTRDYRLHFEDLDETDVSVEVKSRAHDAAASDPWTSLYTDSDASTTGTFNASTPSSRPRLSSRSISDYDGRPTLLYEFDANQLSLYFSLNGSH